MSLFMRFRKHYKTLKEFNTKNLKKMNYYLFSDVLCAITHMSTEKDIRFI